MTTTSKAAPETAHNPDQASTRHLVVDRRFAASLTEDFGIPTATVLSALDGEPKKAAIAICAWAERTSDPARALLAWSHKHHRGRCRPGRRPSRRPRDARRGTQDNRSERWRATTPPDGGSFRLSV